MNPFLRRVVPAGMKRVALGDSSNGAPGAHNRPVFANHFDRVLATGWRESTRWSDQWADANLVEPNHADHDRGDDLTNHCVVPDASERTGRAI